jgi:phosphate starvation-inducible protein PhoH and related proteins
MIEETIHFANAREAQDITGDRLEILARIEKALQVRLTARDTWLRILGNEAHVVHAVRFFELLRRARNQGVTLKEHGIIYTLQQIQAGREVDLEELFRTRIEVAQGKAPIFPRTFGQRLYVDSIRKNDITFGFGPAGTGKTYLAMAMAVATLLKNEVSRIILTRPAIEAGEALGFLPGDLQQKILPYLRPLYDALYDMMPAEEIEKYIERGVIEVAPLAYMRGRTLNHAFIILDEAQNTTREQMLMFLTRLGFDSKCAVTGDLTQIDLPPNKVSGLKEARSLLKDVEGIALIELGDEDVVRHALVQKIIQAYRNGRSASPHDAPTSTPAAVDALNNNASMA